MINTPLVTIVLPCYNAEKFIATSIESVLSQSFGDFELIIINDGSTDDSLSIVNTYNSDVRLKVLSQVNSGANAARNLGVNQATGKYITFIDADDSFKDGALKEMMSLIADYDILVTRAKYNINLDGKEYINWTLDHLLPKELWGKLYKKSIFNQWVMSVPRDLTVGEDFIWNIRSAFYVDKVKIVEDNYYNYQSVNTLSLMRSINKDLNYEERFYDILEQSLRDRELSNLEIYNLLSSQRFYSFFGIVRDLKDFDYDSSFVKKISQKNPLLKNKINRVLFLIMSISNTRIKARLIKWYIKIRRFK
jgi:glycosyltransferase involved in cell wall biosynthesis